MKIYLSLFILLSTTLNINADDADEAKSFPGLISSEILTNFQGLTEYINIKLYLSIMKVASPKIIKRDNYRTRNN